MNVMMSSTIKTAGTPQFIGPTSQQHLQQHESQQREASNDSQRDALGTQQGIEVIKLLLRCGADPSGTDHLGMTALDMTKSGVDCSGAPDRELATLLTDGR